MYFFGFYFRHSIPYPQFLGAIFFGTFWISTNRASTKIHNLGQKKIFGNLFVIFIRKMIVLCICGGDIKGYYIIFTITKHSYSGKQGMKEIKKSILPYFRRIQTLHGQLPVGTGKIRGELLLNCTASMRIMLA